MDDCIFCKIADKQIDALRIYENQSAVAFLDVFPRAKGHTLVIPKTHTPNITTIDEESVEILFASVRRVTRLLKKALKPDGFTIGINHGKVGGQEVDHLHVHIIPRFSGDKGKSLHSVVAAPPKEKPEEIYKHIISKQ